MAWVINICGVYLTFFRFKSQLRMVLPKFFPGYFLVLTPVKNMMYSVKIKLEN